MATDADFIAYVGDQAALGARLSHRKMFGEYALYVDGKVVALVCDNQVFVKPTEAGIRLLGRERAGLPYPGAKPHLQVGDAIEEPGLLQQLLLVTFYALPPPKPRKPRQSKARAPKGPGRG